MSSGATYALEAASCASVSSTTLLSFMLICTREKIMRCRFVLLAVLCKWTLCRYFQSRSLLMSMHESSAVGHHNKLLLMQTATFMQLANICKRIIEERNEWLDHWICGAACASCSHYFVFTFLRNEKVMICNGRHWRVCSDIEWVCYSHQNQIWRFAPVTREPKRYVVIDDNIRGGQEGIWRHLA
jgi:hypothetical protein